MTDSDRPSALRQNNGDDYRRTSLRASLARADSSQDEDGRSSLLSKKDSGLLQGILDRRNSSDNNDGHRPSDRSQSSTYGHHHHRSGRGSHGPRFSSRHSGHGMPLPNSSWDWKTDGVSNDGAIKLLEGGQVQWNWGTAQGFWKIDKEQLLQISVNGGTYSFQLQDEQKHAVMVKPVRNPKSKISRQAPMITYQIETEETAGSVTFKSSARFRMATDGSEGQWSVYRNVLTLNFDGGTKVEKVSSFDLGLTFTGEQYVQFKMDCADPPSWWTHAFEGSADLSPCPILQFVDDPVFQACTGSVIMVNVAVIAVETDHPDWSIWSPLNNMFLFIFSVELVLRLAYSGPYFFVGRDRMWHALDLIIVGIGIFDFVAGHIVRRHGDDEAGGDLRKQSAMLRCLRLLRLLRLLRVFNLFPAMGQFLQALWEMLHKFGGIFLVLFFFIFCSAIILTRTLGKVEVDEDDPPLGAEYTDERAQQIKHRFRDVWTSWFTLFQVTTTDNWDTIATPIVKRNPWWRCFFVTFIVFASWVLISVLTAVASDSMIAMTSDKREFERKEQEKRHSLFIRFLKECFLGADADGNGVLDREEFVTLMGQDRVIKEMRTLGISLTQEEFLKAWEMLDIDSSGELTIDEFVSGLSYLHEALSTKHVVNIDYSLKRVSARLDQRIDLLLEDIQELKKTNNEIIECLATQEEMAKHQSLSLWLWQQWVNAEGGPECANHAPEMGLPTTQVLFEEYSMERGASTRTEVQRGASINTLAGREHSRERQDDHNQSSSHGVAFGGQSSITSEELRELIK